MFSIDIDTLINYAIVFITFVTFIDLIYKYRTPIINFIRRVIALADDLTRGWFSKLLNFVRRYIEGISFLIKALFSKPTIYVFIPWILSSIPIYLYTKSFNDTIGFLCIELTIITIIIFLVDLANRIKLRLFGNRKPGEEEIKKKGWWQFWK